MCVSSVGVGSVNGRCEWVHGRNNDDELREDSMNNTSEENSTLNVCSSSLFSKFFSIIYPTYFFSFHKKNCDKKERWVGDLTTAHAPTLRSYVLMASVMNWKEWLLCCVHKIALVSKGLPHFYEFLLILIRVLHFFL